MTTAVNTTTTTPSSTQSTISSGIASLANNEQTFLALLTTQLKNQDPLSPLDSNQFTAQITQMTGVEQQLTTNQLLQQLVNGASGDISSAVGLIGKVASAAGDTATLKSGAATWSYNQAANASNASLQVTNADGAVVWRGTPDSLASGDHTFTWDGKNEQGVVQPDGQYTLSVAAADATGTAITTTQSITGAVTAVQMSNGAPTVTINGVQIPLSSITSVAAAS